MKTTHWLAFGVSAFWTLGMAYGSTAHAHNIDPGIDLFEVDPTTPLDFSVVPILPDFFGPGSDQFEGLVALHGQPPTGGGHCPADDLGLVSALIRRDSPAQPPTYIPMELLELSLASSQPVTVTYSGGSPELWDLQVETSPLAPSTGQMFISHPNIAGGSFDVQYLIVWPLYTFVRRSDSAVRQIDAATQEAYAFRLRSLSLPWIHAAEEPGSCRSNWCPSPGQPFDLSPPHTGLGGFGLRLTSLCYEQPVAVDASSWGKVKSAYRP